MVARNLAVPESSSFFLFGRVLPSLVRRSHSKTSGFSAPFGAVSATIGIFGMQRHSDRFSCYSERHPVLNFLVALESASVSASRQTVGRMWHAADAPSDFLSRSSGIATLSTLGRCPRYRCRCRRNKPAPTPTSRASPPYTAPPVG